MAVPCCTPLPFVQALSEERASAIAQLQSQLDLANEKVAVLTAELGHLEQEGRQVRQVAACKHTGLRAGACLPGVTWLLGHRLWPRSLLCGGSMCCVSAESAAATAAAC